MLAWAMPSVSRLTIGQFYIQPSQRSENHSTFNTQHSTLKLNIQHSTFNIIKAYEEEFLGSRDSHSDSGTDGGTDRTGNSFLYEPVTLHYSRPLSRGSKRAWALAHSDPHTESQRTRSRAQRICIIKELEQKKNPGNCSDSSIMGTSIMGTDPVILVIHDTSNFAESKPPGPSSISDVSADIFCGGNATQFVLGLKKPS